MEGTLLVTTTIIPSQTSLQISLRLPAPLRPLIHIKKGLDVAPNFSRGMCVVLSWLVAFLLSLNLSAVSLLGIMGHR